MASGVKVITPVELTVYVPTFATTTVVAVQFGDTSAGDADTLHSLTEFAVIVAPDDAVSFVNKFIVWGKP